jgi:hypothetical protein
MKGYSINAQKPTVGKPTTGGSPVHSKMKPGILKGAPKSSGATTDNKKMYKSFDAKSSSAKSGKSSY